MRRPEQALQKLVVDYLRVACPDLIFFHPANGGGRSKVEAAILKGLGVRAGVADLCFVQPGGQASFIELKAEKGSPSQSQKTFRDDCDRQGIPYAVCKSLAEVQGTIRAWGIQSRERVVA